MKIEDTFTLNAPREDVWKAMIDPAIVGPCVPGCEKVDVLSPTSYRAHVGVKVGPVKAKFHLTVDITKQTAPEEILSVTRGEEGSRASVLQADSILRLVAIDPHTTQVFYSSEVSIVGRLGKFGFGFMQKKAKALGEEFAAKFAKTVEKSEERGR